MIRLSDCPYAADIQRAMAGLPGRAMAVAGSTGQRSCIRKVWWNPAAKSGAGAMGIAQFEPDTWHETVDGMGFIDTASPFDPNFAIPAYGWYSRRLRQVWNHVDRTEDDRRRITMACYNCGTGNMLRAQELADGAIDYATIIAALPQITRRRERAADQRVCREDRSVVIWSYPHEQLLRHRPNFRRCGRTARRMGRTGSCWKTSCTSATTPTWSLCPPGLLPTSPRRRGRSGTSIRRGACTDLRQSCTTGPRYWDQESQAATAPMRCCYRPCMRWASMR